ncbi:zinc finger Ran-binding domain-containing protein 2-like [Chenopodium quinoa]|uniref:zinc finger Ran-binding domain-containing protein 2-like n=1 Tax=Chenopodium quinoa TaxID=63459 RepID=UPI000B77CA6A|nr:zinc finger Ran-binding domain-containing protein 2-like [Chenopodium quinoa]
MSSPGDWLCGACQHVNFKKRESCQKCSFSKYGSQADIPYYIANTKSSRTEVLAGDWYCQTMNCGAHNYASRTSCFRCGNLKCDYGTVGVGYGTGDMMMGAGGYSSEQQQQQLMPGWKAGDWICMRPGCGLHNYACRMECYKCRLPRDYGGAM